MFTPVLIIGSGLAGLSAAYQLAKLGIDCTVVTKDASLICGSNSELAQGGIIYRPEGDSEKALLADVLAAGDQINFEPAVRKLATDGIRLVKEILIDDIKVPFDSGFTKEAAHGRARILHVKDQTGKAIMARLSAALKGNPHVRFLTKHILVDLLTSGHNCKGYEFKYHRNRCLGAFLFDVRTSKVKKVLADFTLLATGGVGQVYQYHTNGEHAYGSGLAAANRARVRIINARFVQFHPTALWTSKMGRRFLISEALRGEGARLTNKNGEFFMDRFPQKDLEDRATVARAVMEEMERDSSIRPQKPGSLGMTKKEQSLRVSGHVFLNLADFYKGTIPISERFPGIYGACKKEGIDISRDPIPVVPAAHFFCGGIAVDLHGESELPGLFAAGEVSCTGIHGSNRLASTSLLEALTWGVASADEMHRQRGTVAHNPSVQKAFSLVEDWKSFGEKRADPKWVEKKKQEIRRIMWEKVGILRTKKGLFDAKNELRELWNVIENEYTNGALSEGLIELRHMAETAWIITNSASSHTSLMKDSLGGHVIIH